MKKTVLKKLFNKWSILIAGLLLWIAVGWLLLAPADTNALSAHQTVQSPKRIVAAAPNIAEILFAMGLDDKIAAIPIETDFPPAAKEKPKTGTFWQPNIEAIIAAKPDLVITLSFDRQRNLAYRLSSIGYRCLILEIKSIEQFYNAIKEIGSAANTPTQAEKLTNDIKKQIAAISEKNKNTEKPKVLWVVQREPLRVAGTETFVNEIIELAGGKNAIGPTYQEYPPLGSEQLYACGVEIIIEPAMGNENLDNQQTDAVQYYSKFQNLPAVKNNRIYIIDGDTVSRLAPRLPLGVETIAKCINPELYRN